MKEHSFKISLITIFALISSPSISYSSTILLRRSYAEDLLGASNSFKVVTKSEPSVPIVKTGGEAHEGVPHPFHSAEATSPVENPIKTTPIPKPQPPPETSKPGFLRRLLTAMQSPIYKLQWYYINMDTLRFFSKVETSLFSQVSRMYQAFGSLIHLFPEEAKLRITPIVHYLNRPGMRSKAFSKSAQPLSENELVEKVYQSLIKLQELFTKSSATELQAQKDASTLARHFEPHLLNANSQLQSVTGPLARLRASQSRDQQAISEKLDQDIKYISALHVILGPESVLADATKALLSDQRVRKEWQIPKEWDSDKFVEAVIGLRPHFKKILTYHDQVKAALAAGSEKIITQPVDAIDNIRQFHTRHSAELQRVNGPTLSQITSKLTQTELFRGFRMDLGNPTSPAAHELALLDSFGIAKDYTHALNEIEFQSIGLKHDQAALEALISTPHTVKANAVKRIEHSTEALQIKQELLQTFTPDGLNVFIRNFRRADAKATPSI